MNPEARNTALGYELIAPESGILLGQGPENAVEVPYQLLVALHAREVLGASVEQAFGTSFPIRFDYLDTVDGGSLSVHCHPQADYMKSIFGWEYTQHETYYVMVGSPDNVVFLGLREGVDVDEFRAHAHEAQHAGNPFDIAHYVQRHPAEEHQLFLIPAGTPHGSGKGNVVLEVSATPYLYSLRFYDWLRRDADGRQRPVHVDHAFENLDARRTGSGVVRDLVPRPRLLHSGDGWHEDVLGALPAMFFRVHRIDLEAASAVCEQQMDGRFHVLNVVSGHGAVVRTAQREHRLHFAETIVIPAGVGRYSLTPVGDRAVRIVKAFVA